MTTRSGLRPYAVKRRCTTTRRRASFPLAAAPNWPRATVVAATVTAAIRSIGSVANSPAKSCLAERLSMSIRTNTGNVWHRCEEERWQQHQRDDSLAVNAHPLRRSSKHLFESRSLREQLLPVSAVWTLGNRSVNVNGRQWLPPRTWLPSSLTSSLILVRMQAEIMAF